MKHFSLLLVFVLLFSYHSALAQTPCNGTDTTPPIIEAAYEIDISDCEQLPQPAAVATDDSGNEVALSASTSVFYSSTCDILQPDLGSNPCGYTHPAVFMMFGAPAIYKYFSLNSATFEEFGDGTAHVSFDFTCILQPGGGITGEIFLANGRTWEEWIAVSPFRTYKADCNGLDDEHENWTYYETQPTSYCIGTGDFEGTSLTITHAPMNYQFGYQVGLGANNYSSDFGSGGWLTASGIFIDNANNFTDNNGIVCDIMLKHECAPPTTSVTTKYTATDNCNNQSIFTQNVVACNETKPILKNMPVVGTTMNICDLQNWTADWAYHCDGALTTTHDIAFDITDENEQYTATITATAEDGCGQASSYTFSVLVEGAVIDCDQPTCIGDFDHDHFIGADDIMLFIGGYASHSPFYDTTGDVLVNMDDLMFMIGQFSSLCGD